MAPIPVQQAAPIDPATMIAVQLQVEIPKDPALLHDLPEDALQAIADPLQTPLTDPIPPTTGSTASIPSLPLPDETAQPPSVKQEQPAAIAPSSGIPAESALTNALWALREAQRSGDLAQLANALQSLRNILHQTPSLPPQQAAEIAKIIDGLSKFPQDRLIRHAVDEITGVAPPSAPLPPKPDKATPPGTQDLPAPTALNAQAPKPEISTHKPLPFAEAAQQAATPNGSAESNGSQNPDAGSQNQQQPANGLQLTHASLTQDRGMNATAEGKFDRLLQAEPKNLSEQVTFHMKTASRNGESRISVQLDPVELGKLDIQLSFGRNGRAGVVITAETRQAMELLQKDAAALTNALADLGIKTDSGSLNFNLRGEQQSQQQSQQQAYRQQNGHFMQEADLLEEALLQADPKSYVTQVRDGIDIQI